MKTGSICLFSSATKSIDAKNSCVMKLSHVAPRRLLGSGSNAELIAYKHGKVTGGEVIGYFGLAAWITFERLFSELPSNGR